MLPHWSRGSRVCETASDAEPISRRDIWALTSAERRGAPFIWALTSAERRGAPFSRTASSASAASLLAHRIQRVGGVGELLLGSVERPLGALLGLVTALSCGHHGRSLLAAGKDVLHARAKASAQALEAREALLHLLERFWVPLHAVCVVAQARRHVLDVDERGLEASARY